MQITDDFKVSKGQYTFDSEGHEGGPYHTRKAHHPTSYSGITIGRGYDLKTKTKEEVRKDFTSAEIDPIVVEEYVECVGLTGEVASQKVQSGTLKEITTRQQKLLFEIIYQKHEDYIKDEWQSWDTIDYRIREFLTDLRYRGDYKRSTIELFKKYVENNDAAGLKLAFEENLANFGGGKQRNEFRKKILEQPQK